MSGLNLSQEPDEGTAINKGLPTKTNPSLPSPSFCSFGHKMKKRSNMKDLPKNAHTPDDKSVQKLSQQLKLLRQEIAFATNINDNKKIPSYVNVGSTKN